jgi:hypothetical protein
VDEFQEDAGTIFEQRRAVHDGYCWRITVYRVRQRRDGVPIWFRFDQEPDVYCSIRWLLRDRPDVQRGSIHNDPVFESDNHEPPPQRPKPRPRRVPPRTLPPTSDPVALFHRLFRPVEDAKAG